MLDGSSAHGDEANIGNVENNNPATLLSAGDGLNAGGKARQALLKKGGRKLRPAAPLHHQRAPRSSPVACLSDHNNNNNNALGAEPPGAAQTVLSLHHVKQGAKKEMVKTKGGRLERGATQPGGQSARNLPRRDQAPQNTNSRGHKPKQSQTPVTKKKDNSSPNKPTSLHREQKKPLHPSNNLKALKASPAQTAPDGEKVYAGAKFSEPPSPSVLPKPPSHWVGENEPQKSNQSREQMTVHLKSLLKVQDLS